MKEKGQPEKNKHKLENGIKIDLKGIGYNCCELDCFAYDRRFLASWFNCWHNYKSLKKDSLTFN